MYGVFAREWLTREHVPRGPSPSALLGTSGVRAAMSEGGQVDGRTASGYLYHSARISRVIAGCRHCVDLGCGTGVQLLQVAALNPEIEFTGVDNAPEMLDVAARDARALGVGNVSWRLHDLTHPPALADGEFDAAISTMTLHDLSDVAALNRFVALIRTALTPGGAFYLEDFGRLRLASSMDFFVGLNAPPEPDAFTALYRASLGAAFTVEELKSAASRLPGAQIYSTFPVPFLLVVKSPDREPSQSVLARLESRRRGLSALQRRDLADLARFFAFGGLRDDPFRRT
jgi:SAM-dependent methyltransferase